MTGENPKPYLSEGGIGAEDNSIVTRYRADACWNGYTVINEADHKLMFELSPEGETVWKYRAPVRWRVGRCHRVGYDFADVLAELPTPVERDVEHGSTPQRPKPVYEDGSCNPLIPSDPCS